MKQPNNLKYKNRPFRVRLNEAYQFRRFEKIRMDSSGIDYDVLKVEKEYLIMSLVKWSRWRFIRKLQRLFIKIKYR